MESDRELVARWRAGDEGAFQELVDRHKHLVYALLFRAVAEEAQADTLAQEVFLRVHRGLPYFRGEASVTTWIYRTVADAFVEATTRHPASAAPVMERGRNGDSLRAALAETGRRKIDDEWGQRLEFAISRLPPHSRLLVAAHGLEGVPCEDLVVGRQSAGAARTMLHHAKRQLRRLLDVEP